MIFRKIISLYKEKGDKMVLLQEVTPQDREESPGWSDDKIIKFKQIEEKSAPRKEALTPFGDFILYELDKESGVFDLNNTELFQIDPNNKFVRETLERLENNGLLEKLYKSADVYKIPPNPDNIGHILKEIEHGHIHPEDHEKIQQIFEENKQDYIENMGKFSDQNVIDFIENYKIRMKIWYPEDDKFERFLDNYHQEIYEDLKENFKKIYEKNYEEFIENGGIFPEEASIKLRNFNEIRKSLNINDEELENFIKEYHEKALEEWDKNNQELGKEKIGYEEIKIHGKNLQHSDETAMDMSTEELALEFAKLKNNSSLEIT